MKKPKLFSHSVWSLALVFAGTVVGAGFASGLEIWTFFGKYGLCGLLGVVLASVIISVCGSGIMLGTATGDFENYDSFCRLIAGKISGKIFSFLGKIFMFSTFCIMLSGSGALFAQELDFSYEFGVSFMAVICFITFLFGIKGITSVNCILTPLMLLGMTILGIYSVVFDSRSVFKGYSDLLSVSSSLVSAMIYVSYNLLSVPPVIISLKNKISSLSVALAGGLIGGGLLGISALFMYLSSITDGFLSSQLPALTLAHKLGDKFGVFYGITIYFSMFTTAIGAGYGFTSEIQKTVPRIPVFFISLFLCISAGALSLLGFSTLVNSLYTTIGYSALLLTFLLISYSIKKLKKSAVYISKKPGSK